MNIGNIGSELEDVDGAYRKFTDAVEGPCMEDYPSDEVAYAALRNAATALQSAASALLARLGSEAGAATPPPRAEDAAPPPALEHLLDERKQQVAKMHDDALRTDLGYYWEGYGEGLKFAESMILRELRAAASVAPPTSVDKK